MVWGTDDVALSKKCPIASANDVENYSLEYIEGASHFVQQDKPEEVNEKIRNFICGGGEAPASGKEPSEGAKL